MKLAEAFGIVPGDVVAFTGAGGKTALLVALGYELAEAGWRVLATTTVGMDADQAEMMPITIPIDDGADAISSALNGHRFVFVYDSIRRSQVQGLDQTQIARLLDAVDSDIWLVEADVSDGVAVKAPLTGQPVIPAGTSLVVPIASMVALGQPLDDTHVYNVDAIIQRYGFPRDARIKAAWLAQIIRDEELGLRGVPTGARLIPFLNQTPPRGYGRARARMVARLILRSPRFHGVVLGSVRGSPPVHEIQRPVAAVVLAAGLSTRMGQSKVMLPWADGRTIIEHIIDQLVKSRIDHIVVVTGHQAKEVKALLKPLDIEVVYNRQYKSGEMLSSINAGLNALPGHIAAALIVPGDLPRLQPRVLYQVLSAYAEGEGPDFVVPGYGSQPGYPVLVSRRFWGEIQQLAPHASWQQVIDTHPERVYTFDTGSDSVLCDVNTPQDYREARYLAGLGS